MMSLARRCILRLLQTAVASSYRSGHFSKVGTPALGARQFTLSACRLCEENAVERKEDKPEGKKGHVINKVSVQESIKYMESEAFKTIYGENLVWKHYRRNFRGQFAPRPRASCSIKGKLTTASPCPLCRDDYLVVSYKNTALLKQFISELTGEPLEPRMTGLCMKQYKHVKLEVARAQDYGLLEKSHHFRKYDYEYYQKLARQIRESAAKDLTFGERENAGAGKDDSEATSDMTVESESSRGKEEILEQTAERRRFQKTDTRTRDNRQAMADIIQKKYKIK